MFLAHALRVHGSWTSIRALFLVLFLATWAGGAWLEPFGPAAWNVYCLPFLLIAVLVAVLVAAIAPPRDRTQADVVEREHELELGLGVFFWMLVASLLILVVLRYL